MSRAAAGHSLARTLAALLGAPLIAISVCCALAAFAPCSEPARVALGLQLAIPLWVCAACCLPLSASGRRAWSVCVVISAPLLLALALRAWR